MASTINASKKSRGRPAIGKGVPIQVRLQPDLLAKIDALRAKHDPVPSRPEAIRQIIEATFKMMGGDDLARFVDTVEERDAARIARWSADDRIRAALGKRASKKED